MIYEGIIVSQDPDGGAHVTPMGFRRTGAQVLVAPFVPSQTLDNLRRTPRAVLCLTDDVRVFAGALTGRRTWPLVPAERIAGWRLAACLAHLELEVEGEQVDATRPRFTLRIVHEGVHRAFRGFNRAQAAVVEAAILVSRLDFIEPAKLVQEMDYLSIAVEKTAGARERSAWSWLLAAIAAHPRHGAGALPVRSAEPTAS